MPMFKSFAHIFKSCLLLASIFMASCNKEETFIDLPVSGPEQVFYAISGNTLVAYNAKNVKTTVSSVNLQNLSIAETNKERILSISFRPHSGELYGLSNLGKIYIINVSTGFCKAVANKAFTPALDDPNASIDFDPTTDKIRLITIKGLHLSIDPQTLETEKLADVPLNIFGISYNNAFAGAETSTLYNIDYIANKLFKQEGTALQEIGNLETILGTTVSFDINADNKNALAVSKTTEGTRLFAIDLTTGKATLRGKFPFGVEIQCIAIPAVPVAYLIDGNNFITFNPTASSTPYTKPISGLQTGESIVGMDMSPLTGQIYAIGSTSRLYAVNAATAVFRPITVLSNPLEGTNFAVDFNSIGNLSVISNTGQSLTITTAGVITVNPIIPATNSISALAYNNNATTATAYVVDDKNDKLYTLVPTTGVLTEVGDLKVDVDGVNGFDIYSSGTNNSAVGIFTVAGETKSYNIDLTTGLATAQGTAIKSTNALTLGLRF
jgi:hypothetical protein